MNSQALKVPMALGLDHRFQFPLYLKSADFQFDESCFDANYSLLTLNFEERKPLIVSGRTSWISARISL